MRPFRSTAALVVSAVLALTAAIGIPVACTGCLGVQARDHALLPTVQLAWDGVRADILMGPNQADPGAVDMLSSAIESGSRASVAGVAPTTWPGLRVVAEANINAAATTQALKDSKLERVKNFDEALRVLIERLE